MRQTNADGQSYPQQAKPLKAATERDTVSKHPFRTAIENGASQDELTGLLADDVVLMAPMLTMPVTGAARVANVLASAARAADPIEYTLEVADPRQTFLMWNGRSHGFRLQAVTILADDSEGLISEIRVLMRPWPVVTLFRNDMYQMLADVIPAASWELQPKPQPSGPRQFTPIAMRHIESAPDMVLHSPMLAKAVHGKQEVAEAVRIAHEVQSASSYTSIIATPDFLVELFDCDADGYPMEGMWIQNINADGLVNELSVYLRPYPAVTVLRNRAKQIAQQGKFLGGDDYWELP
jgi:hypothetical protein